LPLRKGVTAHCKRWDRESDISSVMERISIQIRVAPTDCWSCGAETTIVSSIQLMLGETRVECAVADFTAFPALIEPIKQQIAGSENVSEIKMRFSKTLERSYMSNGCSHCDALFGQHFELHLRYSERTIAELSQPADKDWWTMMSDLRSSEDGHLFRF
jgi:competence protein CoiA